MTRRFFRPIVHALIAAQVLLSAPVVSAMSAAPHSTANEMPCADSMPEAAESGSCPCCPDGTSGVAACLGACAATIGALPTFALFSVSYLVTAAPPPPLVRNVADAADPPLKPPPIV